MRPPVEEVDDPRPPEEEEEEEEELEDPVLPGRVSRNRSVTLRAESGGAYLNYLTFRLTSPFRRSCRRPCA